MHLLRKLVFVLGVSLLLVSQVQALGVGGSELHSALNQPLKADIELTNLGDLREDDIVVSLASNDDFERAGIDRLMFYSQLNFELMLDHETGPKIRVTTREPVREPYLNFLLELRWASGRLIREYTFLLDLPTFDEDSGAAAGQAVEAAGRSDRSVGREQPQGSRSAPAQTRREDTPTQTRTSRTTSGGSYGPVGSSDTLWEIALEVRPDRDLSVQQTMLALQRKNPEAFINGNINMLREGQILRLPNRQEIQAVSQRQAINQVAQHNRDWSASKTGAQLDASGRQTSRQAAGGGPEGQLRLATPAQETTNRAGQGGGANDGDGQALANELAVTREELDKTRRENRELAARVEDLEAQIDTMERLIEASNEQLRALQTASEQNRQESAGQDKLAAGAGDDSAQLQPKTASDPEQGAEQDTSTDDQTAAAPNQAEQASGESNKRVVRSVPQSKSWLDLVMENLLWVAVAALAVVLVIYYGYRRRSQREAPANHQEPLDSNEFDSDEPFALGPDQDGDYEQESTPEEDYISGGDDNEFEQNEADEGQDQIEAETGDAVAEADIYIAYGKLDQAEELLLKELKKDPRAPAVLTKLLELYSEKQDVESFDRHYATLLATDDRASIQRGGELREMIPGAPPFDVSALDQLPAGAQDTESESDQGLDQAESEGLDFDLDDLDSTTYSPETQTTEKTETESLSSDQDQDQDFDFDLDEDFEFDLGELDEDTERRTEPSLEDNDELTFGQEPSADFGEEPSAEFGEEPSAEFGEEPSAEFSEEPSADLEKEPSADLEKEPSTESDESLSTADNENLLSPETDASTTDAQEPVYELDSDEDDFSFDWEDKASTQKAPDAGSIEDDFPELDVSLDELPTSEDEALTEPESESPESALTVDKDEADALDDWDLDLEPDEQSLSALDTELSDLDELDDEPAQSRGEEQPGSEEQAPDEQAADDQLESSRLEEDDQSSTRVDEEPEAEVLAETLDSDTDSTSYDPVQELSDLDANLDEDASLDKTANWDESVSPDEESMVEEPQPEEPDAEEDLGQDRTVEQASGETADEPSEEQDEDSMFEEALSGLDEHDAPEDNLEQDQATEQKTQPDEEMSEEAMDEELDFLADADEAATKLDLARAYIDMGDADGARDILEEVAQEGDEQQKQEAQELLGRI